MTPVTDWFPGEVKPVYVGEYERDYGDSERRHLWDGSFWFYWSGIEARWDMSSHQSLPWRGLAEEAK
jgi:hypothetical protein